MNVMCLEMSTLYLRKKWFGQLDSIGRNVCRTNIEGKTSFLWRLSAFSGKSGLDTVPGSIFDDTRKYYEDLHLRILCRCFWIFRRSSFRLSFGQVALLQIWCFWSGWAGLSLIVVILVFSFVNEYIKGDCNGHHCFRLRPKLVVFHGSPLASWGSLWRRVTGGKGFSP